MYYCMEAVMSKPTLVAEISFPMSKEMNTNCTLSIKGKNASAYDFPFPNLEKINPDMERATLYIDLTHMMNNPLYNPEDYTWNLSYTNQYTDTVGQPVYYKLKYYADNEQDYASSPTLSYKQFTSNGRIQTQNLDLSLQYALSGKSPYTIDETHQFIEVPFGNQAYKFSSSFMGGE